MTGAMVLGVMSGMATLLALLPVAAQLTPRRFEERIAPHTAHRPPPMRLRPRRFDRLADDLATQRTLEALARSLRSGRTLTEALMMLSPPDEATSGRHLLHDTLLVAATAGTSPVTVVEHAAVVAGDRVAARQERRAQAAQARLSATVLTWVPVGVGGLAMVADDDVRRVMLTTPLGLACLGTGVALGVVGRRWIRRLTEASAP